MESYSSESSRAFVSTFTLKPYRQGLLDGLTFAVKDLIDIKQRSRKMKNAGVDFAKHDFAKLADTFGGAGHTVTSVAELKTALSEAHNVDTFTVIAAVIDRGAYDGRI